MNFKFFRPKNDLSVYWNLSFEGLPTLSDVIKALDWGSNRDIRQKGFRVVPIEPEPGIIKTWPRYTDPRFQITCTSFVTSKGASVAVIHVPEKKKKKGTKKEKSSDLKLYVKPEPDKAPGEWPFLWRTNSEIENYVGKGWVRFRDT